MARTTIATPGFLDRLGDRVVVNDRAGGDLEVLRLRPELTTSPDFERCLKERAEQLTSFQHRNFARVRGISRLPAPDGRMAVVSDAVKGWRLSDVLQAAEQDEQAIHTSAALFILRQIASATAALQATGSGIAHGALGPERVVLSAGGHVQIVEYVLGTALEHLPAQPADRLWKELRIAVGEGEAGSRFTPQNDVLQLGLIALALVHNRQLRRDEFPGRLAELVETATESNLTGARQPLGAMLRGWVERAVGLAQGSRWTMGEALQGLENVSKDGAYLSTPVGLEPLLRAVERFFEPEEDAPSADEASEPAPRPDPAPPAARTTAPVGVERSRTLDTPPDLTRPATESSPAQARLLSLVRPVDTARREASAPASPSATPSAPAAVSPTPVAAPAPVVISTPLVVGGGAAQAVARLPEELLDRPPAPSAIPAEPDPLLMTTSPLAEFAAERASDPLPAPAPASGAGEVKPLPPPRPSLRPVPAAHGASSVERTEDVEVGPVADMLSVGRSTQRRNAGWSNDTVASRSGDRQSSGARAAAVAASPQTRTSKSGGISAAATKQHEPPPEATASRDGAPPTEVGAQPGRGEMAAHTQRVAPRPTPSAVSAPAERAHAPSPSLFGLASGTAAEAAEEHAEAGGGKGKWLALAGAVVVCVLGIGGWMVMKPSGNGTGAAAVKTQAEAAPPSAPPAGSAAATGAPAAPAPAPPAAAAAEPVASAPAEPVTGSVTVLAAVPVNVGEKGSALGSSGTPIALPVGRHVLELSNEELGYSATHVVDVRAGRPARVQVALPEGTVNINATPWAEVVVDGQRVGETPLGNLKLTVGTHEVRFRHPQLGEQVRSIVVTTRTPGRLSVDMKQ